jgi:hypothetical protein
VGKIHSSQLDDASTMNNGIRKRLDDKKIDYCQVLVISGGSPFHKFGAHFGGPYFAHKFQIGDRHSLLIILGGCGFYSASSLIPEI